MSTPSEATPGETAAPNPADPKAVPAGSRSQRWWLPVLGMVALLSLAGVLRAWGLDWGLPGAHRYYPGHPDESVLLLAICNVNPLWGDVTPTFYNYGSLLILLVRVVFDLASPLLGWASVPRQEPFPQWVGDFARLLWLGRACNVALGVTGVGLLVAAGTRLFGARAGWSAGLFFAIAPLPVILGHYLTVDMPATTLCLGVLAAAAVALQAAVAIEGDTPIQDDRQGATFRKALLAGGLLAGLAAGTKYNAGLVFLVLLVPCWFRANRERQTGGALRWDFLPWLVVAGVAALIAFVAATPGVILETAKFQEDLSYELWRNREGQGLIFKGTAPTWVYHLGISLPIGMEWPLYLLGIAGLRWAIRHRRPADLLLLAYLAVTFLPLLPAERKFVRYVAPIVPVLCLLAARLLDQLLATPLKRPAIGFGTIATGAALASTIAHLGVMSAPDARDQAASYLRENARTEDVVALGADPWYYTPPLDPSTGCVKAATPFGGPPIWDRFPNASRPLLFPLGPYQVLAPDSFTEAKLPAGALPVSRLKEIRPRYVVLTDYEYEDPQRLRDLDPKYQSGILDLLEALKDGYRMKREFRPRPSFAGFTWWRNGIPPHDWRYYMPTVRIYERTDS